MGFLPDDWTRLSELDHFPYLDKCMEQGIISIEGLLGQCMADPKAAQAWLSCTDDEWRDLLVLLISAAPVFAEEVYSAELKRYGLGALLPKDLDEGE